MLPAGLPTLVSSLVLSLAGATLAGGLAASVPSNAVFAAVMFGAATLVLPAAAAVLLASSPAASSIGLALVLFPVMSYGWRRLPPGLWGAARALGGSPLLVVRALLLPVLAMPIALAACLGTALLVARIALRA